MPTEKAITLNINEVLARYSEPTTYEKQNGLQHRSGWQLLRDHGDVKFFTRDAHDGTLTMLIIFRAGTTENWCGWMINEPQADVMKTVFGKLYDERRRRL